MTLPDCSSSDLVLGHPTPDECISISTKTWTAWGDSLPLSTYLEESQFLTTIPLARDGGLTQWILVDRYLAAGKRPILASCESFWKRALTSTAKGDVEDCVVHGIASVFTFPEYRGRGYAARLMRELARVLRTWQTGSLRCIGSVLYSDIGKKYYARLGWQPNSTNRHVELQAVPQSKHPSIREVLVSNLQELCARDETMIRTALSVPPDDGKSRVAILPDVDHMLWHIGKEEFACEYLYRKVPKAKGVIFGNPGSQVWATWTHRYYTHPEAEAADTVLYILRLVMELDTTAIRLACDPTKQLSDEQYAEQSVHLKAVLQAAQAEAAEWGLKVVKLWNPSPLVTRLLEHSEIHYSVVDREEDSIASGLWYPEREHDDLATPHWIMNEHYGWC